VDAVVTAVREGHAVVLGLQVTESFQLARNLPIDFVNESDPVLFNHAVLAVGVDDDRELAVVKNSWGIGWGDAGYAPVTYRYLRHYGRLALELEN
jgi:C1A family cysteine protease